MGRVVHQQAFGDLEHETARVDPGQLDRLAHAVLETRVAKLLRRHVDRDVLELDATGVPLDQLHAGDLEHPVAEVVDEPDRFRERNEHRGRHQPMHRMKPPDQRLDPHHAMALAAGDWLEVERELAIAHAVVEVGL